MKPTPGSQLALFARYSYHAFITDRDGETLELEADHRRHAEVENAIRDLKYGVGLKHISAKLRRAGNRASGLTGRRTMVWASGPITKTPGGGSSALVERGLTLHLPRRWP